MKYIPRLVTEAVLRGLDNFPVVAITGPRQCGKSTLVKHLLKTKRELLYLDLERPSDLRKLDDAEWFLTANKDKLICLDEIQRKPGLFPLIRSLCDEWGIHGNFLVLGSASRELLKQSSESLAGRISYKKLSPFLWSEVKNFTTPENYLSLGGFPSSLLAKSELISYEWRESFISTYIERDLLQWTGAQPMAVRRLWQMLVHVNGQTINYSSLANSLGLSHTTIKNYIDVLTATYMVDLVQPHIINTGKRLVKSPKIYLTDSGIAASLLGLKNFNQLSGHPVLGSLWEGTVLSNLRGQFPATDIRFYRTNHGSEIDFLLVLPETLIAIECKAGLSPTIGRGTYTAIDDLKPLHTFIVAPVVNGYPHSKGIDVVNLDELTGRMAELLAK